MTRKPTDQLLESLSAMVDDEASEIELRRVLKSLDDEESALEHWHRYNLVGAVMRKEAHADCSVNLVDAISAEIHGEGGNQAVAESSRSTDKSSDKSYGARQSLPKWRLFAGQSAIAASVAAAFVFSFHFLGSDSASQSSLPQFASSSQVESEAASVVSSVPLGFDLPLPEARVVSGGEQIASPPRASQQRSQAALRGLSSRYSDDLSDMATQALLDELLIEHASRSSVNGSLGIMPFARVSKMGQSE